MKKLTALFTAVLLLAASLLTGCRSPLSRGLERSAKLYGTNELDLTTVFSEEDGFHYPEITWDMTIEQIQETTYASIAQLMGVSDEYGISYEMSGLTKALLGRKNDSSVVNTNPDGLCYLVSIVYELSDNEGIKSIGLQDLFDQYGEKIREVYGEPEDSVDEVRTVESTKVRYVTSYWEYTTASGITTQLQWSVAYVSGATAPSYLTLGFTATEAE